MFCYKTMKKLTAIFLLFVISLCAYFNFSVFITETAYAADPVVIVIDPGHGGVGGRNLGCQYNNLSEKVITMETALAMKAELEKYENVVVYLTRTTDVEMSLQARADFAKSVNADFMFSIHYNASSEHKFYGSEIWVPSAKNYYNKCATFGNIESQELAGLGVYQKGVKTKLNSKGTDYYGVIRCSVENAIPCVIIEHCYIDHGSDKPFFSQTDSFSKFGVADATAVAKYFHLKSSTLGVDYTDYKYNTVSTSKSRVADDTTAPNVCQISASAPDAAGNVTVTLTAKDDQSLVIYYAYSLDGGATYSYLQPFDANQQTINFTLKVPSGKSSNLVVQAYNQYELFTTSNVVNINY